VGKVIALDFGLKRTGIALSDENKIFAFGLKTIASNSLDSFLKEILQNEKIDTLVLGEPKRLNTDDTHISHNVRLLKEHILKSFPGLKLVMHDERFTSKMASQAISQSGLSKSKRENKSLIDEVSATILLQSYLSSIS
jgi:putative Holliday junction resolvase